MTAYRGNAHTHNNGTETLTFTDKSSRDIEQKTQKKQPRPKIVTCIIYVTVLAILTRRHSLKCTSPPICVHKTDREMDRHTQRRTNLPIS